MTDWRAPMRLFVSIAVRRLRDTEISIFVRSETQNLKSGTGYGYTSRAGASRVILSGKASMSARLSLHTARGQSIFVSVRFPAARTSGPRRQIF